MKDPKVVLETILTEPHPLCFRRRRIPGAPPLEQRRQSPSLLNHPQLSPRDERVLADHRPTRPQVEGKKGEGEVEIDGFVMIRDGFIPDSFMEDDQNLTQKPRNSNRRDLLEEEDEERRDL